MRGSSDGLRRLFVGQPDAGQQVGRRRADLPDDHRRRTGSSVPSSTCGRASRRRAARARGRRRSPRRSPARPPSARTAARELVERVGHLRRDVLVQRQRPHRAAGEHAHVAHREVDPRRGLGVELDRVPRAPARGRDARVVERLSSVAAKNRSPNSSIPRARTSAASAASGSRARSAARDVAQRRPPARPAPAGRRRAGSGSGSTGSTTAATASAIDAAGQRVERPRERESAARRCVTVNTSTAETATWLTNSWLVPKNIPSPTAMDTASASCATPGAELVGEQVRGRDPERDRADQLQRPPPALVVARARARSSPRPGAKNGVVVPQQPLRDRPRQRDGHAGLDHHPPARPHALPARAPSTRASARPRPRTGRSGITARDGTRRGRARAAARRTRGAASSQPSRS